MRGAEERHRRGLEACLTDHFGSPVAIAELTYLTGGGSRILARFGAAVTVDGVAEHHRLVFRLDPPSSFVESDRAAEFHALAALDGSGLPIPRPVFLDAEGSIFGAPFFVMTEVPGGRASAFVDVDPYGAHAGAIGRALFETVGRLAAIDVDAIGIRAALPDPGVNPAATQLDHWVGVLDADESMPQPIVRAGIRALRRRLPPPPAKLSVVHGDLRSGNFLVDGDRLVALLDWEFVHLGDPLEDIAWCADPLWGHGDAARVGGMLPLAETVAAWEAGSGMTADRDRLDWWRLFSAVRGMAMWTSASDEFDAGGGVAEMTVPALNCAPLHERVIAETLWRWSGMGEEAA